jgi:toluene monooxygenase system ferredoxin subunit
MSFVRVAAASELWTGELLRVCVAQTPVLLVRTGSVVRAYADRCVHQRVPLSRGKLCGNVLTCSAHGWEYDLQSGRGINPCGVALRSFPVKVEAGTIWVDVDVRQRVGGEVCGVP